MIVRYARERDYQGQGEDPHLTLGKSYVVLGIDFCNGSDPHKVLIQSDAEESPSLWKLKFFDVIDPRLPNGWVCSDLGRGIYRLAPEEFSGDFWDIFHNGDANAERIFAQIAERIRLFHSYTL